MPNVKKNATIMNNTAANTGYEAELWQMADGLCGTAWTWLSRSMSSSALSTLAVTPNGKDCFAPLAMTTIALYLQ